MKVILKKGKEKAVLQRHHWIFSGAVLKADEGISDGDMVQVVDQLGNVLGWGYYNGKSQIRVRMLSFGTDDFTGDSLRGLILSCIKKRKDDPLLNSSTMYRLINSEGDFLPGLIVDFYSGHLVIQALYAGIDKLKNDIAAILIEELKPESIYERSDHSGRRAEGLSEFSGQIFGTTPEEIACEERGLKFYIDIKNGQKTGFFIDQRENRQLVRNLAKGRSVLNLFCYTGGFSVAAGMGGARSVISVDASKSAIEALGKNIRINCLEDICSSNVSDVFQYIRNSEIDADFIILDPPAFAKNRSSVDSALKGYKDINFQIIKKCRPNSYLLTFSCSRFIDMELFQKVVFSAALDSGRKVSIAGKAGHPSDHPVNIYVPETEYLKSILLLVE